MSVALERYRRVVAFGAHPDDLEVGAGGLIARLAALGAEVTMVVASIPNQYAARRAEAVAGAAELGAKLVLPDEAEASRVEDHQQHALVARFDRVVGDVAPDLAIVHGAYDLHWDHAVVHRAALSALRRARGDVLAFATRLPIGAAPPPATCIVDISTTIDVKLAAIAMHATQFPPTFADSRRDIARVVGAPHGFAYGEAFEVLRIVM